MSESLALDPVLKEWLAEFKSLPESSISEYSKGIPDKSEISDALMKLFGSHSKSEDILQPVCHQLFEFYRSGEENLIRFTINLFPSIISHHVVSAYTGGSTTPIDTLLLSIYTISSSKAQEGEISEVPQLGNPSIYHDPISGPFSEQMFNKKSSKKFYRKPFLPNHETILPSNRYEILTHILDRYFCNIALMRKQSLMNMCYMCKFLASSGYRWQNKYLGEGQRMRRYPLSGDFMIKMLRCLYFALYDKCFLDALQGAEAINYRAKKELIPEVIFLCNAVLDSARELKESGDAEGQSPLGIPSANLTPMVSRESTRRKGRWAATARSVKDHKWRHNNEVISGDLSTSMQSTDMQPSSAKPSYSQDNEEVKSEKHFSPSPAKHLKTKSKKSAISGVIDKSKSPAPSTGDKKSKKQSDDQEAQEKVRKSSSQHKELHSRYSSTSLQKHSSMDDASIASKTKPDPSLSKSSNDVTKTSNATKVQAVIHATREEPNNLAIPFIDQSEQDVKNESTDSDEKESYPLLPANETPTKTKSTVEQTAF